MIDTLLLAILIILVSVIVYNWMHFAWDDTEKFSTGTFEQLYSKDVQDINLTVNTEKYLTPYDWNVNSNFFWNMPTRFPSYYPYSFYPFNNYNNYNSGYYPYYNYYPRDRPYGRHRYSSWW